MAKVHAFWWTPLAKWSAKCDSHWICSHSCGEHWGVPEKFQMVSQPEFDESRVTCKRCLAKRKVKDAK